MTPQEIMLTGGLSALFGLFLAALNMLSAVKGRRSIGSIFFGHAVAAIFWIGGGLTLLSGLIMFLIDYSKR